MITYLVLRFIYSFPRKKCKIMRTESQMVWKIQLS